MLSRVENTISRYNMFPPAGPVGVAVSGGADSVFLLHALRQLLPNPLLVIHVNHGLRGEQSEEDERFVRGLHGDVRVFRMGPPSGNLEQFCRRFRQACFRELTGSGAVARVATGHNADDQAETVLMRLLRGTGPAGLRGILPVTREGVARPLLNVGRDEIREFLTRLQVPWREDESNGSNRFLRNRIRNEVLPLLARLQPRVVEALGQTAELAAQDEDYWRRQTEETGAELNIGTIRGAHPALASRRVRAALQAGLGGLERIEHKHIEEILRLAAGTAGAGRIDLPGGSAVRSFGTLRILTERERPAPSQEIEPPFQTRTEGYEISGSEGPAGPEEFALDLERIQGELRLKCWEPRDRFQAANQTGDRPVREFFQKFRVPSWERPFWPMITDSVGIVWIHRFGSAQRTAVTEQTRRVLRIRCSRVSSK